MKLWLLLSLTILSINFSPVSAQVQIPGFVRPGVIVTYSGTVNPLLGQSASSSQQITVDAVTSSPYHNVSGTTIVTNYLGGSNGQGNYVVIGGPTNPLMWNCGDTGCSIHGAPLGTITQFWVDPTNAAASIIGPQSAKYTKIDNCPSSVYIPNVTCLESKGPPYNSSNPTPTYDLLLGFDTTGFVRYSFQIFEPKGTFEGLIGQLEYFAQTSIPWQVAGPNLLLQADVTSGQGNLQGGGVQIWQPSGTRTNIATPDASWHIVSTNYIKSKQNFDVLWQNNNGDIAIWELNGINGTNQVLDGVVGMAAPGWRAVGLGDFFGRGVSDILFQNNSGEITIWEMNGLQPTPRVVVPMDTPEPAGWHVIGTGDFFHTGFASGILFQHDDGGVAIWEMNGNTVVNPSGYLGVPQPAGWHALGTGDFFGRGYASDILFQHDNSDVAIWEMNGMVANELYVDKPGANWHVKGVCNCTQSGKSDILLQNDSGEVVIWEMNGTSSYGHASLFNPGPGWHL